MKKVYASVLLLVCTCTLSAQSPVIDLSNLPPPGGELTRYTVSYDQAPSIPGGEEQIWDITGSGTQLYPHAFAPPSGFAGGIDVQDATVMELFPASELPYYRSNSEGYAQISFYVHVSDDAFYYTDPILFLIYPCTYGTTWDDGYTLVDQGGGVLQQFGPITYTADGYGTLITDLGTHTDVLKVRTQQQEVYEVDGVMHTRELTTDRFWKQGTAWYVAEVNVTREYIDGDLVDTWSNAVIVDALSTGVSDESPATTPLIYPNPSSDRVILRSPFNGRTTVIVLDAMGRTVRTSLLSTGVQPMDVTTLAPGHYVVHFINERGEQTTNAFMRE